ncbi:MAG TPA: penicillin-binding protein [Terriglobales bacterium]|nr:penicillin-binding protein [Terriglobales bacterium]
MTSKKKTELRRRTTVLFLLAVLFVLAVLLRVFQLQVVKSSQIQKLALRQQEVCLKLEAKRGVIYDRNMEVLAFNLPSESFFAVPESVSNKSLVADRFSGLTEKSGLEIKGSLCQEGKRFVWLKRKCEEEEADKVKSWNLKGVYVQAETKRSYPYYPLACDMLGFTDIDNKGSAGVEYQYNQFLSGKDGKGIFQKDAWGNSYQIKEYPLVHPQSGNSLVLTLDLDLQAKLEDELKNSIKITGSEAGSGILLDPRTGEILAMAYISKENSENTSSELRLKNRLVCDNFEPGSTFKIVTAAAALEKGIKKPEDSLYAEKGKFKIGKKTFHDIHQYGWLTFKDCVVLSSNIGMAKIAMEVGDEDLLDYAKRFGFGEKTGIDLPGEAKGLLPSSARKWSDITTATFAIGQGISVTPLQLASAYAAIANGGLLFKPYVVKEVLDEDGKVVQEFHPTQVRRALEPKTAYILTEFLRGVVSDGTGNTVKIEGVNIAGKTGTAEKPKIGQRGYQNGKYIASFVGFFPAENPQMVGFIMLDSPKGMHYGGQTAGPAFKRVTEKIIPTENLLVKNKIEKPMVSFAVASGTQDYERQKSAVQAATLQKGQLNDLKVLSQKEKTDSAGEEKDLKSSQDRSLMPDLTGLTVREAVKLLSSYSIQVNLQGSGRVIKQIPLPGKKLAGGETCFLECKSND